MSASSRAASKRQDSRLRAVGIKLGCDKRVQVAVGQHNWVQPCSDPRCIFRAGDKR